MKRKIYFYCLSLLFLFVISCNEQIESEKTPRVLSETTIPLKTRILDEHSAENGALKKGIILDKSQQNQLFLSQIDEAQKDLSSYPDIQYYCLDSIAHNKNGTALLISRLYEMEDFVWIALYDSDMKLKDFRTVFFDEYAESAHHIYAQFENPLITLSEYKMDLGSGDETNDTSLFSISEDLVFSKGAKK